MEKIGMPENFYFIGCGGLIWSREKLAFVPKLPVLNEKSVMEELKEFYFPDLEQALQQANELLAFGVDVEIAQYQRITKPNQQ